MPAPEPDPEPAPVPVHPEAVPDDATALRWVMPAGTLAFVGVPAALPGPLQVLLDDGTLDGVRVEPDAVRLTIGGARSWRAEGGRVREALQLGLAEPDAWAAAGEADADDVLRMAVEQVIAGDVGDYVRGHGGRIALLSVSAGRVEVSLGGACSHCPASDVTLTHRFENAVRARCPEVVEIVAHDEPGAATGRGLLRLLPTRRA